jgi:hypothetical protein
MGGMKLVKTDNASLLVGYFVKQHVCPGCSAEWTDEWSCECNDRCPECDLESSPVSSIDLSRPLCEEDYLRAARAMAITRQSVTDEQARDYAESRVERG